MYSEFGSEAGDQYSEVRLVRLTQLMFCVLLMKCWGDASNAIEVFVFVISVYIYVIVYGLLFVSIE